MGETAKKFGVEISTIRYWEKEFSILKPKKNKRGVRYFTQKDIENLHLIYHLVKEKKMTLKGASEYLKNHEKQGRYKIELLTRLENIQNVLKRIKEQMQCIE